MDNENQQRLPDILLNTPVKYADRYCIQPVFIEIETVENTHCNLYNVNIQIFRHSAANPEELYREFNIPIKVFDYCIPEKKSFDLNIWQHNCNIARKHEVVCYSDEHFAILENYIKTLAGLGQKSVTIIASDAPWDSQGTYKFRNDGIDLYEYSCITSKRSITGDFIFDYSKMQRYIDLCAKYGIDRRIEVIGLCGVWGNSSLGTGIVIKDSPDNIKILYIDDKDNCCKYMNSKKEIMCFIEALYNYFVSTNQIDKVRISSDEPLDYDYYFNLVTDIKKACPDFKFQAAIYHVDFIKKLKNIVDDIIFCFGSYGYCFDEIEKIRKEIPADYYFYLAFFPSHPNTVIRSNLLETRLIAYIYEKFNFKGFLRWAYTAWPKNPRESSDCHKGTWQNGETHFVYPSYGGLPLVSLRYKMLERAVCDYELLSNCDSSIKNKVLSLIIKDEKVKNYYSFTEDGYEIPVYRDEQKKKYYSLEYSDYNKAKNIMLEYLEKNKMN